jgi:alpha-glucoside transport system substrate-binding protein
MTKKRQILAKPNVVRLLQWWQRKNKSIVIFLLSLLVIISCQNNRVDRSPQATIGKTPTIIDILTAFNPNDALVYKKTLSSFEQNTGTIVNIIPASAEFANVVSVAAQGLNTPDLALFPQPSLLQQLARSDNLKPLSPEIQNLVRQNFPEELNKTVTYDGNIYGIWTQTALKSLVWYRSDLFTRRGYQPPQTWQELEVLSRRMIRDGYTPWCIGVKAKGGNGWVVTDWIEEIMLRLHGGEIYDRWVSHQIPFDSPEVLAAFNLFDKLIRTPNMVYGGRAGMLSTFVEDAAAPMFARSPRCLMHRQAEWIRFQFPANTTYGKEGKIDVFPLPPMGNKNQKPVLAAGDAIAIFNDRPEVLALAKYLTTNTYGEARITTGGYLSPNKTIALDKYPNAIGRTIAQFWQNATAIKIDASDLMPPEVGTGSFWTGAIDFIEGKDVKQVLREIDATWHDSQQQY